MNWTYVLLAFAMALISVIIDWQIDKTSFLTAGKKHIVKYIVIFVVGGFLAGYLLGVWWIRIILVCAGVYYFWTLLANVFTSKIKA